MTPVPFTVETFYDQLGLPEASLIDKRIFKRMVLDHGQLTAADKKTLSGEVTRLTWKYTLKASTVQVLPYEDDEREYLEVAVVEVVFRSRGRATRVAEMVQRAIPHPVLLVLVEGAGFGVSVAHKRFSRAEKGTIVAEDHLCSPWMDQLQSDTDRAFCKALALKNLSQIDFYALYRSMADAVLGRCCAELTGHFAVGVGEATTDRKVRLEQCHTLEREIASLRVSIRSEDRFSDKVELNTQIKRLEDRLLDTKASL